MKDIIEKAWEKRAEINAATRGELRDAVEQTLAQLDSGKLRVAEKQGKDWLVNQWAKKAVLLSFRLNANNKMGDLFYDKVPLKTYGWS
jgi:2,3,4,5-tetrahydropyridine-2-carboxylate N-succinyltransferase